MTGKKGDAEGASPIGIKRVGGSEPKRINVSNQAVADELLATTKVLHLQQEDNYKSRDHIQLLGGELDALKKVVEEKQSRLNKKDRQIAELEDTITTLNATMKEIKIERAAFKVLEDQNSDMLKRFQAHVRAIDELERENKALKANQTDVRGYADKKVSKAVEVEVLLNAEIQELTLKLSAAEIAKASAVAELTSTKSTVLDLKQSLQMVNELRVEQVNRSRMTEYKTLRKIDEITSKFVHERDEKDKMRETVQLAQLRGNVLEERLSNVLEAKEEEQLMVETLVSQAEFNNDAMRTREQILSRENMALTAQLKLTQKAVNDMIKRYRKLEGLYEEVKAVAARVHVGKQLPFVGIGRSLELTSQISAQRGGSINGNLNTVRQPHPEAPPPRAKTPKPPVPDPLEATKLYVNTLSAISQQRGGGGSGGRQQQQQQDDYDYYSDPGLVPISSEEERSRAESSHPDLSRDLLDEDGGGGGGGGDYDDYDGQKQQFLLDTVTATASVSKTHQTIASPRPPPRSGQLPAIIITTDGCQHAGKRNLLVAYLQFTLGVLQQQQQHQHHRVDTLSLAHFAITDEDFKLVVQFFRMMPLRRLQRIDLSHNMLSAKSVDAISAWIVSIAPQDLLGRGSTLLEIDLRHNQFTRRSVEKMGLKIRATPRPEVPLVAFEHDAYAIALYSPSAPVLRIDCRKNKGVPGKPTIKSFINLGSAGTTEMLPVGFPGSYDGGEDVVVYPRDAILEAKTV